MLAAAGLGRLLAPWAGPEAAYLLFTVAVMISARQGGLWSGLLGLFGPKDMPQVTRERIAADVRTIMKATETEQRLKGVGLVSRGSTPAEFAQVIEEQRAKWSAVARANSIEPQ